MKTQRFEFEHIVLDIIRNADKTVPFIEEGKSALVWMSPDAGRDHEVLKVEIFEVPEALGIVENALKDIQIAQGINEDYSSSLSNSRETDNLLFCDKLSSLSCPDTIIIDGECNCGNIGRINSDGLCEDCAKKEEGESPEGQR